MPGSDAEFSTFTLETSHLQLLFQLALFCIVCLELPTSNFRLLFELALFLRTHLRVGFVITISP